MIDVCNIADDDDDLGSLRYGDGKEVTEQNNEDGDDIVRDEPICSILPFRL